MKNISFTVLLLIAGLFIACENEQSQELAALEELEAAIESGTATEAELAELREKYVEYMEKYPEDADGNSAHLYTLAMIEFRGERYSAALDLLKEALREHYIQERAAAQVQFMGTIYRDHLNKPALGNASYWAFTEAFPDNSKATVFRDSLLTDVPGIPAQLDSITQKLYDEEAGRIDFVQAKQYIDLSEIYVLAMPQREESPDMLSEAAKVAGYINAHERAMGLYSWLYERYAQHPKAGQALFMMGFIQDNNLEDKQAAAEYYEAFLAEYPDDEFAEHARFLLDNLDKTNEEIIEGFEQGQQ